MKRLILRLLSSLFLIVVTAAQPLTAAVLLAWGVHAAGLARQWPTAAWIAAAPLLYVLWLLLCIGLSATEMQLLYRAGHHGLGSPGRRKRVPLRTFFYLFAKYGRETAFSCLPLFTVLRRMPTVQRLALLAYAPATHIGWRAMVWGRLYDPELTFIDAYAVVGGNSTIVAHSLNTDGDVGMIYAYAPVRIGKRAVVGGECRVAMGVEIGADAIVEGGSSVTAYTVIGAGEVWGGNPAVFLRHRDGSPAAGHRPPAAAREVDADELALLVRQALNLPASTPTAELAAGRVAAWDSLGQLAICAAMRTRYAVELTPEQAFGMRCLADIHAWIRGATNRHSPAAPASTTPINAEELPLLPRADAERRLARLGAVRRRASRGSVKVVVAATFTVEPVTAAAVAWADAFGVDLRLAFAPFGHVQQSLLAAASPLAAGAGVQGLVLVRLEDLPGADAGEVEAQVDQLLAGIAAFQQRHPRAAELLVGTLPPMLDAAPAAWCELLRAKWAAAIDAMPRVRAFDFSGAVQRVGLTAAADAAFAVAARAPYSPVVWRELGIELARALRRRHVPPAKVLALDCDNTLWGGVVAEDAVDGLQLGRDGPGRAYRILQQRAKELQAGGVLLTLVSRNREEDVWEVFAKHPGMVLKRDDIAASRFTWQAKSQALRDMAEELGLALDAFVFVDDDPLQQLEVRAHAPAVTVVPLAGEPATYASMLARLWAFDTDVRTVEDRTRTLMLREQKERQHEQGVAADMDAYLRELRLRVELFRPTAHHLPRIAQLTQKTNQFNATLKRRSVDAIRALPEGALLFGCRACDRFGDYGVIGAAVVEPRDGGRIWCLDTFLLSCRALGRGVEHAFLAGLARTAQAAGARTLQITPVDGPRNQPARDFFAEIGFAAVTGADGLHRLDLTQAAPAAPAHIELDVRVASAPAEPPSA